MKALSAPQTAMRHHSQRGPRTAGKAAQQERRRADSEEQRRKSAQTETFYLEGLESDFSTLNLLELKSCTVAVVDS